MEEERWLWVGGGASVAGGLLLLFLWWSTTLTFGCPDPGICHATPVNSLGVAGMALLALGVGLFTFAAWLMARGNPDFKALFYFVSINLVVVLVVFAVVFNPLSSPIDYIRDSDLDGTTDDHDFYPNDKDWDHPTVLQLEIAWANTSTNWTVHVKDVYVLWWGGPPALTEDHILVVTKYASTSHPYDVEIGTLEEVNNTWEKGVQFLDGRPYGLLSANDTFILDCRLYLRGTDVTVFDSAGYETCSFSIVL